MTERGLSKADGESLELDIVDELMAEKAAAGKKNPREIMAGVNGRN